MNKLLHRLFCVLAFACLILLYLIAGANDAGVIPFSQIVLWATLISAAGLVSSYVAWGRDNE